VGGRQEIAMVDIGDYCPRSAAMLGRKKGEAGKGVSRVRCSNLLTMNMRNARIQRSMWDSSFSVIFNTSI